PSPTTIAAICGSISWGRRVGSSAPARGCPNGIGDPGTTVARAHAGGGPSWPLNRGSPAGGGSGGSALSAIVGCTAARFDGIGAENGGGDGENSGGDGGIA